MEEATIRGKNALMQTELTPENRNYCNALQETERRK